MTSPLEVKYQRALHEVLNFEGGYVNNPKDPGGATNHGITQRTYDSWRHRHGLPVCPVLKIADSEVAAIYKEDFWNPMGCDKYVYPIALMLFDTAVQWGVHDAFFKILAECPALRTAPVSQSTIVQRLLSCGDVESLVLQIFDSRKSFRLRRVKEKPTQVIFLKGWNNRDVKVRDLALRALAGASVK